MRRMILAAAVATTALSTPAFAQDADPTFTGFRIGALVGYDTVRPGSTEDSDIAGADQNVDGVTYGLDVGYDFAIGGLVAGVEAELTDSTGKDTPNGGGAGYTGFGRVEAGRDIYVGARVGGKIAPRTLIYAKGGYTNQRLDVLASDGTTQTGDKFNLDGWRLGAGVEQAFGSNLYGKVEYRYSNYSDAKLEFVNGGTTSSFDIDTDRHQVLAGVGWRF